MTDSQSPIDTLVGFGVQDLRSTATVYDLLLALIPSAFIVSGAVSTLLSLSTYTAVLSAAVISLATITYALFVNPPHTENTTATTDTPPALPAPETQDSSIAPATPDMDSPGPDPDPGTGPGPGPNPGPSPDTPNGPSPNAADTEVEA